MTPSSIPPPSAPPPSAPPEARATETMACAACGQRFDFRAPSCPRCGFPQPSSAPLLASPRAAKSPRNAMWLSLAWPGAGHLYAGDAEKGAILSAVSLVLAVLSMTLVGAGLGLVPWLGLALYAAIDAGRAADARNARRS